MDYTSLDPLFIPASHSADAASIAPVGTEFNMADFRHSIATLPFNSAYDTFRANAIALVNDGQSQRAIEFLLDFDTLVTRMPETTTRLSDIHATLMQILTAIYLRCDMIDQALQSAAASLTILSQQPRRKDEPFLFILASLLYDIALLHHSRQEHKQAERAIEKSLKLFQRLARINPSRYGHPQHMALNASTTIYQSVVKQTNTLIQYQEETNNYLQTLKLQGPDADPDIALRFVDSLSAQGRTLAKMGRQREAIQYFTKALKYLTKIQPQFTIEQLDLSIDLGQALLTGKTTRDKGIHLLNTMLFKANKLAAADRHRHIVDILVGTKNSSLDIFAFWHKMFPR